MPLIRLFPSLSQFGEAAISLAFELHIVRLPWYTSVHICLNTHRMNSNLRAFYVYMYHLSECEETCQINVGRSFCTAVSEKIIFSIFIQE